MTTNTSNELKDWMTPDAVLQYQRLKLRKKQLSARCSNNLNESAPIAKESLLGLVVAQKRKNPFARNEICKKIKTDEDTFNPNDDSLFNLINNKPVCVKETPPPPAKLTLRPFDPKSFSQLLNPLNNPKEELLIENKEKWTDTLPFDWSIKTRIRLFCESQLPSTNLKTSQEASGITSFVRCIDPKKSTDSLDISPSSRLNNSNYYWQHPHLPWMTMFPRNSKANSGITIGEREKLSLAKDWKDSFHGLFRLLRAKQCPYFYLCANTFTVLFRAAGVGGRVEMHAFMSPTSRGIRSSFKKEGIEFSMPFKKDWNLNQSNEESVLSQSIQNQETVQSEEICDQSNNESNEDDDLEEEEWLESLGVDKKEIKKMSTTAARQKLRREMVDDFSETSLVLIEGAECQAFFNFLLNSKSVIATVGRLAGVPPTLLAPVAFPLATLQTLTTRSSKIRMDGIDYFSIELKGIILPHILNNICLLLAEQKDKFSATLVSSNCTLAFSKATTKIMEDEKDKNNSDEIFYKENLSDCGLLSEVVDLICRTSTDSSFLFERVVYNKEFGYGCS